MKYIIVKDIAILATRDIESRANGSLEVRVEGAADGASLCIQNGTERHSFFILSESARIPLATLKEGIYNVSISWTADGSLHTIEGNSFKVWVEKGKTNIAPAPLSSATELENMWKGITNMLEVFIPFMEEIKNGYEVI